MRRLVPVLLGLLVVTGCTVASDVDEPLQAEDLDGTFTVEHAKATGRLAALASELRDSGAAEDAVALVNARVRLAEDVVVTVRSCPAGSGYDPETRAIDICLEELADVRGLLEDAEADDVDAELARVMTETITHETGHALLDLDRLPFTGREETVADQFSAYVLIGGDGDAGLDAMESTAYAYELSADAYEAEASDEHDSDAQRAVNIQCWVYGADRRDSEHLIAKNGLSKARAEFCHEEWEDLRDGWNDLLRDAGALRTPVE